VTSFVPRIVAFCCDKSGYVAADRMGRLGSSLLGSLDVIRVPCAGRVDVTHVLQAIEHGADGVLVFACHEDNCQSLTGNRIVQARIERVHRLMEDIGLERERLELRHVATTNGAKFARVVERKFRELQTLGPSPVR
jgi:F420-non-reducing hydrogenase iron-sulfur subunit